MYLTIATMVFIYTRKANYFHLGSEFLGINSIDSEYRSKQLRDRRRIGKHHPNYNIDAIVDGSCLDVCDLTFFWYDSAAMSGRAENYHPFLLTTFYFTSNIRISLSLKTEVVVPTGK